MTKATRASRHAGLVPEGFFAFRTPLLPFDEFLRWGEGLEAAAAYDRAQLEDALAADRARLRAGLLAAFNRPGIRDALFVASPDLDAAVAVWSTDPDSVRAPRIERALVRYLARMAGRATPFGLFGGHSLGAIGGPTRLAISGRDAYRRHTRLDMDYLFALVDALGRDPALRQVFEYRPNSTLYRAAGRIWYVQSRARDDQRAYHLVAAEPSDALDATLDRAKDGAGAAGLAAPLVDDEVTLADAEEYIADLIASQVLVPDIALNVTGVEPIHTLVEQLGRHGATAPIAERLDRVRTALSAIDARGLGADPDCYRGTARLLDDLPAQAALPRLFQVDMVKPAPGASLDRAVVAEIVRGAEILQRLARRRPDDPLTRFTALFRSRYDDREVPLVEAVQDETGIGFPPSSAFDSDATPLLDRLVFPGERADSQPWGAREIVLQRKVGEAVADRRFEIVLEPRDLEEMASPDPPPLPDAFAVTAAVAASSERELANGRFRVLMVGTSGPSGALLLGRFCHADPALHEAVALHLRREEAADPDAVFAELVHLPEGRVGNILLRPVLREYEITYLGRSGAPLERQIPITDLRLAASGRGLQLRSARLGRRVIPRLSTAHNFTWRSLGVYYFLCALQAQGSVDALGWDWGTLRTAPFLPRVTTGRLVLARAQWRLDQAALMRLGRERGAARFEAVRAWRAGQRVPRLVVLADADNMLPVDFDNVLSVESFVHLVKDREEAYLLELFPGPDELCARGPEGRFVHELVVPFVCTRHDDAADPARAQTAIAPAPVATDGFRRSFPPGSEWFYLKIYTGSAAADDLLRDVVAPWVRDVQARGLVDRWFFVRYADPDAHLRVRLHGDPRRLHEQVVPAVHRLFGPLLDDGRAWRMQIDTYEREVERYGGGEGVLLAERIFHADAETALDIIEMLEPGEPGADERWRLTLRGIDMLLTDLGFDLETSRSVVARVRGDFARELRADRNVRRQLTRKFDEQRRGLEALLDRGNDPASPLAPGLEALQRRSVRLAPIVGELKACADAGRLSKPLDELASSYIHMHANRMLRGAHRAQEYVLYDLLGRLYDSRAARVRYRGASR